MLKVALSLGGLFQHRFARFLSRPRGRCPRRTAAGPIMASGQPRPPSYPPPSPPDWGADESEGEAVQDKQRRRAEPQPEEAVVRSFT